MTYRTVSRILTSAGWVEVRSTGSHHQFKHPDYKAVVTVPYHGGKDISKRVISSIQRATGLKLQ